jgi:hypothetical protein
MRIFMGKTWQVETQQYMPRLSALADHWVAAQKTLPKFQIPPFSDEVTLEQSVAFHLASFAQNGLIVVDQLFDNVGLLWSQGRMVGISGLVRFSLKYWAAVFFALKIHRTYLKDQDLEEAARKTGRLTFSGKTPVKLPWGGQTENVAYSILTLIDALNKERPTVRAAYDFLSEASHPNFLQNTYFIMSSRVYDNFSNEALRTHAHQILDRTLGALEQSVHGTIEHGGELIQLTLPLLPKA